VSEGSERAPRDDPERAPDRTVSDAAIALLRRLAAVAARHAAPDDAARFGVALARYEAGAAQGLTFDAALGLTPRQSKRGWWTVEARQRRDLKIRALRLLRFAELTDAAAAVAIVRLARAHPQLFGDYPAPRSTRHVLRILTRARVAAALPPVQPHP